MIKKYFYKKGDRKAWLALRDQFSVKAMLGGSDISTVMNANNFKSAIELYYQMVGFIPKSFMTNDKMAFGSGFEDTIAEMYQYWDKETNSVAENFELGLKVNPFRRMNAVITNDKFPYLFANIDGISGTTVIEIKNTSKFVLDIYKEPTPVLEFANCPAFVPPMYYLQLQQYMMILEKSHGRFVFMIDGSEMKVIDIEADPFLQNLINEASIDFGTRVELGKKIMKENQEENHQLNLLSAIEPEVTDQETYNKFRSTQLEEFIEYRQDHTMMGNDRQFDIALEYMKHSTIIKEAKKLQTLASNQLKTEFLKNSIETLDFDINGKVTLKKRLSVSIKPN